MATAFDVTDTKFYDQIVNDTDFSANPTDFNTIPTGNVGDELQLIQDIEISTSYNLGLSKGVTVDEMDWDVTKASITCFDNWFTEGFYPNASISVSYNGGTPTTITILTITAGNTKFTMTKAHGDAIIALDAGLDFDELTTLLTFKLLSAPTFIKYSYGLNALDFVGENYQSPLDSNLQEYYGAPNATLGFIGGQIGSSLGTVAASSITTTDTYRHQVTITHTFTIPYYISGQFTNVQTMTPPANLIGSNSFRYDNRLEVGNPIYHNSIGVNFGDTGNIGYFGENFNGLVNDYTISDVVITNASGTGKLEITEVNTVSFKITSATDDFQSGIALIASHSKLPTTLEYQNKTTAFDTIWVRETLRNTEGAAAVSGTLISNFEINIDSPKVLEVEFVATFSADEQLILTNESKYKLSITVANKDLADSTIIDRVNLVIDANTYSKNTDVAGLLLNNFVKLYPSFDAFSGTYYSAFTGGIGDLWGSQCEVDMNKLANARIVSANFKVLASNSTNTMELSNTYIPMYPIEEFFDGVRYNQVHNIDIANNLNIPSDDPLNRLVGTITASIAALTEQPAIFRCGFQTPWRDWVENLNIAMSFYDITKPQNNRNLKTSNYSGVDSYAIYGVWTFDVTNNTYDVPTTYNIYTSPSSIIDFDSASWSMTSAEVTLETLGGDPVLEVSTDEDLIVRVKFTHAAGILALNTLEVDAWIERYSSTLAPHFLSTHSDWTADDNWLKPSNIVDVANYQFVELISVSNLVTAVFKTNSDNINAVGTIANIYGKLWKK